MRTRLALPSLVLASILAITAIAVAKPVPTPDPGTDGVYGTADPFESQFPDVVGPYIVDATATVGASGGGGGDDANIQCIWDLVDMDRPFLGNSQADDGDSWWIDPPDSVKVGQLPAYWMDYAWFDGFLNPAVSDPFWYDDAREDTVGGLPIVPGHGPGTPCVENVPGVPADGAEYTDFSMNVIQVYANAGDVTNPGPDGVFGTADDENLGTAGSPTGERVIELWMALDGPGNNIAEIQQVYWDIYHPDGTKKVQVHDFTGVQALLPDGTADPNGCAQGYFNWLGAGAADPFDPGSFGISGPNTVFGAAVGTSQMTMDAAEAIIDQCAQNHKKLYFDHFTLSKHQPCGPYEIRAHAIANSGLETMLTNFITVLCFIHLDLDFTAVEYTPANPLQPTDQTQVDGDTTMLIGDGRPTAINAGSGSLVVGVDFTKLTNADNKHITKFDLQFGVNPFGGLETALDPNGPGVDTDLTTIEVDTIGTPVRAALPATPASTLCANETGKFIFSIHTNSATQGVYEGTIDILAMPAPDPTWCANTDGVWGGYHDLGPNGLPNGGGPTFEPDDHPLFDDDYGRNQRSVVNP